MPIGRPSILFPTGRHTRSLPDRRQIHRRIYCFADRYVIWPLSSEPRGRVALATLCRRSAAREVDANDVNDAILLLTIIAFLIAEPRGQKEYPDLRVVRVRLEDSRSRRSILFLRVRCGDRDAT